ncbi:hypothetical protein [Aliarcobacter cryaerophilus]|uniref:hypothetical protein n=1 Tax=Aliarcobacter cryaerophilus TaxID=28198 RepID=UPI0021B56086|nr:hypothetical protein [Aliarcobacter cryaerophilus]MCT7493882.1 hypothetical protein [Aliarcobacter cryaerophilus]
MAKDIETLIQILNKEYKTCPNSNQILDITRQIKKNKELDYKLKPLEFIFINNPSHLSHTNIENLRLFFSINIKGKYKDITELKDPLTLLELNIWITGVNKNNKSSNPFYSIHFDRHIEGGNKSDDVHPIYHFQFGGKKIKEKNIDKGQALFMDAPRIMYHPIDIFLGVDFVLSNFFPLIWIKCKKDGRYINLIRKYQKYFVYPYFKTISQHFETSTTKIWDSKEIYPQLVEVKY